MMILKLIGILYTISLCLQKMEPKENISKIILLSLKKTVSTRMLDIHTILGSTLSYHVFLTTVAFRNTYPNQAYTSHARHALSWLKRPYSKVLGLHFTTRVAPTMIRREHNNGISSVWVDTDKRQTQPHYHRPEKSCSDTIKGEGDAPLMERDGSTVIL